MLSFGAALERIYELFAKAYCVKAGAMVDAIADFWKEVESQSERQYGLFCQSFLLVTGRPWHAEQNQIKLRNKVIHKGYIATRTEAESYAQYVTESLDTLISIMHSDLCEECS